MMQWQLLQLNSKVLIPAINILHQASQFMAMVSHAYASHRPDDSHNAFAWNEVTNTLEGIWIEDASVQLKLDVLTFELIIDKYDNFESLFLDGRTKQEIHYWLHEQLVSVNLDAGKLKPITHFTTPEQHVTAGKLFSKPQHSVIKEWTKYLSNAKLIINEIKLAFKWTSEIRVWPHHFDMGLYIPVERDEAGNDIQSIGLGLAIPDSYVEEPYFYINHWSSKPIQYPDELPEMCCGYWNKKDWIGLVLPASSVLAQTSQEEVIRRFFLEGITASQCVLQKSNVSVSNDVS